MLSSRSRGPLSSSASPPFWNKDRHAERRGRLVARARVTSFIRRWFDAKGFLEVEPAAIQASPGNETHLHGFRTTLIQPDGSPSDAYLHTSPEFAMKKLLAAGETQIFALARVFRNRERTALHAPEFTMLEWYRVGAPLERIMDDCAALMRLAAHVAGAKTLAFRGREADPFEPPERLSVREACRRYAGVDLYDSLAPGGDPDAATLKRQARTPDCASPTTTHGRTSSVASSANGSNRISALVGRPSSMPIPSAKRRSRAPAPTIRAWRSASNSIVAAVELANAFNELIDPVEQRRRFAADMAEQQRIYGASYPIDDDFLGALAQMPAASGAALGLDRLVMLATGAERVEAVQWTPVFNPGEASR